MLARMSTIVTRNVSMPIGQFINLIVVLAMFVAQHVRSVCWCVVVFVMLQNIVAMNVAKRIRMIMNAFQDVINVAKMV